MNIFTTKSRALLTSVATLLLLSACSEGPQENWQTVTLNGTVEMVAGPLPAGKLHYRLYVLEAYPEAGDLAHPLGEIEDFSTDSATFTHVFEYPLHKGTGLAIHAWVDTDGDDAFCTPNVRQDPGGLALTEETPSGEIDMTITLTDNCRNASWFYPPAP